MRNKTQWNERTIAKNYNFGRPLDEHVILQLFERIERKTHVSFNGASLLDAGCGTGRITIPVAKRYKKLNVTGADISPEMVWVLTNELKRLTIKNYQTCQCDLLNLPFHSNQYNFSLISSVLHAIPDWKKALIEVIRTIKPGGFLFLVSEESTIYNLGLGRIKNNNETLTEKFWYKYIQLRAIHKLGSPEKSQTGIRWLLGYPEVIYFLTSKGVILSKDTITLSWNHLFTIEDFMKIVEKRCWSSMFTANSVYYRKLISDMKSWLIENNISVKSKCNCDNIIQCEILRVKPL